MLAHPLEALPVSPEIELNLALILFIPWFSILAVLFWCFPRQPRSATRKAFDTISLLLATAAAFAGMHWSMVNADPSHGPMWKQVLATSVAYGLFLAVMVVALVVRWRWLRRSRTDAP